MGFMIYNVLLVLFIIPISIRAYLSLKNGRFPLPYFQNNVVINRIKLRRAIGVLSPVLFWVFHGVWLALNISMDAWLGALATVVYMVISTMLSEQIKQKQVGVIPEKAGVEDTGHS